MGDRLELAFRRAADALLPEETSVLAAVSGGSDSMALLHLLVRMAAGRPPCSLCGQPLDPEGHACPRLN